MKYRKDRYGNDISLLGFGCMRFPQTAGRIQMEETEREIMAAIEGGINYFDTAYVYTGSEAALGTILEKNSVRDKVKIATKLPHYLVRSRESIDKYFGEHLKRLRTDYIDYYLMHMLTDVPAWEKLKSLGIEEWLDNKKKSGAIRQVGFSYHGNSDEFCKLLDAYDWDFCQIQYNYLDENSQAGRVGLDYAYSKGIPVIIMEPLRGGKLVSKLPAEATRIFKEYPQQYTPAQWAFRWLYNQPAVTCVLSGMNSMEMLRENIKTASETEVGDLGEAEEQMLKNVVKAINSKLKVGCTGCRYCMPCPFGVDIPGTFSAYNNCYSQGTFTGWREYLMCTALRKESSAASMCRQCGKCEKHCPQAIPIRQELKRAKRKLQGPVYWIARKFIKIFKMY